MGVNDGAGESPPALSAFLAGLVFAWTETRAELAEIARSEHPDVIDQYGRLWVWVSGDLYQHDGMAFPHDFVVNSGLPSAILANNPNYHLCSICRQNWSKDVDNSVRTR